MELQNLYEALSYIKPEISVAVYLILIVLFDLIFNNDKKFLHYIALIGVLVTGFFVIDQFGFTGTAFLSEGNPSAQGMVAIDPFGSFFKLIVLIASVLIILFSMSSDEIKKSFDRLGEYYTLMFGMILGMFMMISASDLILIYLSIELLSLSSYVLAGFTKLRDRNSEAALKYIIYGAVSSGLMLFGISIIFGLTGNTNIFVINQILQTADINLVAFSTAVLLVFVGIGFKISAAPFHFWTPDVYEGSPITITAFLSVASKAAGFALLIRLIKSMFIIDVTEQGYWQLVELFDWKSLLIIISILTMTLGNFSALWQDNLKRMLAYSSIAHAGYILLGIAVLSNQGLLAVMIYFLVYTIMNLGAFFIVMIIANKTGSENIDDYDGLGITTPFLGVALAIFLVSLTGLPPTAGFIGKLYLFIALVDAQMIVVALIALLNTVVSLYYYIRVLKHLFLTKPTEQTSVVPVSGMNTVLIILLIIPVLFFGIYFTPMVDLARNGIAMLGF